MVDLKSITIIIPHLGITQEQKDALAACYASLVSTVPKVPIVTVKNAWSKLDSTPAGTIALVEQGQCRAVNAAVATVNTEWIFVTNDDMLFAPGWLDKLVEGMEDKLCVSPNLVEPIEGAPPFIRQLFGRHETFELDKWLDYARQHEDKTWETGFNLPFLIRSDLWHTIGGYDINYDPWGSNGDSDLQAKIHLAGVQTWRNRNSIVYHFSQSSGTSRPENRPYWQKNWDYFVQKWGFPRASSPDVWYSQNLINYDKLVFKPEWMGDHGELK